MKEIININTNDRLGPFRASVFSSGCEVWVYDNSYLEKIHESGFWVDEIDEEKMKPIVKDGLLVAYELFQDDSIEVDVYVGEQLNKDELNFEFWFEPQEAFIRIPSGKLCIETNDTCRLCIENFEDFDPSDIDNEDRGAIIDVPSGDYILTLYRQKYDKIYKSGLEYKGPEDIIILTKSERAKPFENPDPFIKYDWSDFNK